MKIIESKKILKFSIDAVLKTSLLMKSGKIGAFADSEIEMTPDKKKVHINGYVWASLFRRALKRVSGAEEFANTIGDYNKDEIRVSPFWFEASFFEIINTDIRPGIKIDRERGATETGGLYSDEVISPGHEFTINFNVFHSENNIDESKEKIISAISIINENIETIGGGWSYGFGKLEITRIRTCKLDPAEKKVKKAKRKGNKKSETAYKPIEKIFCYDDSLNWSEEKICSELDCKHNNSWEKIIVKARITPGQLLGISSNVPTFANYNTHYKKLPDTFVFKTGRVKNNNDNQFILYEPIITGKSIRQALFSVTIERELISLAEDNNELQMENWFGSLKKRGIISIGDSPVTKDEYIVLNRIQLCEHSMQNINLFAGEYLCKGEFEFTIIIDLKNGDPENLKNKIVEYLEGMKNNSGAPPGWNRIGGTSTCTGQIEVVSYG